MKRNHLLLLILCFTFISTPAVVQAQIPGDANADSMVNLGDVVCEIDYLYKNGPYPLCLDCADPNADCGINLGDVVYLINYLYKTGQIPEIPECDWSEPVNLGSTINSSAGEASFRLCPNGKTAVWSSNRSGTYGNTDIWYSYWNSASSFWSEAHNCGHNINNGADDEYPSLSPDGNKLYCRLFGRLGTLGNYWDVWVSAWDSLHNEWGPIENLGPTINLFGAGSPFISPDGTKLYFSNYGLWVSEWNGTDWGQPVWLGNKVNVDGSECDPTVTADNKTLYLTRCRGRDHWYICVSHWTGTEWGPAVVLDTTINDTGGVVQPYITPDGSTLYFISARPGGLGSGDVWVSQRIPMAKPKRTSDTR